MELSDLTNPQLAAIAVARLGGATKAVDAEDVADAVFAIAPSRFCWKKHPDRIDLYTVRLALKDALRLLPPLLAGGIRNGWMLSPAGLAWIEQLPGDEFAVSDAKRGSLLATQALERNRLQRTRAYAKFKSGRRDYTVADFEEFARVNEYFPHKQRVERFAVLDNSVFGDPELEGIWMDLKAAFEEGAGHDD